jgi:hypothetical protein
MKEQKEELQPLPSLHIPGFFAISMIYFAGVANVVVGTSVSV